MAMGKIKRLEDNFQVNPRTKAVIGTLSCGVRVEISPMTNPKENWHKIMKQIISCPDSLVKDIERFCYTAVLPKDKDKIHAIRILKIASGFIYGILETGESGIMIDGIDDNRKATLHIVKRLFKKMIETHGLKIDDLKNFNKTYINDGLNRLKNIKPNEQTPIELALTLAELISTVCYTINNDFWRIMFLLAASKKIDTDFFKSSEYSSQANLINKAFPNL